LRWHLQDPLDQVLETEFSNAMRIERYSTARAVLANPVFSAAGDQEAPPGFIIGMDPPAHSRCRRSVTPYFTRRRIQDFRSLIEAIVQERLDALEVTGPPADLVPVFVDAVPFQAICEIVGVPTSAREEVQRITSILTDLRFDPADSMAAHRALIIFFQDIADDGSCDGMLRDLIRDGLDSRQAAGLGVMLLNAGYETMAGAFGMGLLELFRHTDQLTYLYRGLADGEIVSRAIEEILRYRTPLRFGIPRNATHEVAVGESTVAAGQSVTISLERINRDPDRFDSPEQFDIRRQGPRHLAFGHGNHQCLGSELARLELKIMLRGLLGRFPGLALTVSPSRVPLLQESLLARCKNLPVTWGPGDGRPRP
jgi:cytochrome P450